MDKAQASVTKSEAVVAFRSVLAGMSVVNRRAETKIIACGRREERGQCWSLKAVSG